MKDFQLFMILLGCRPKGRNTEQHDIFFGIAKELKDLVTDMKNFWQGANPIHIDGWRAVRTVEDYEITISENKVNKTNTENLFFLNLGGYKENHFEEFHYKMLTVAASKKLAVAKAKQTAFYLHTGFGIDAAAHVDERYGIDVDDIFEIKDILTNEMKKRFSINLTKKNNEELKADEIQLGYFPLESL